MSQVVFSVHHYESTMLHPEPLGLRLADQPPLLHASPGSVSAQAVSLPSRLKYRTLKAQQKGCFLYEVFPGCCPLMYCRINDIFYLRLVVASICFLVSGVTMGDSRDWMWFLPTCESSAGVRTRSTHAADGRGRFSLTRWLHC